MIIVYHGSDANFNKFSFKKMGTSSGTTGAGFGLYFSDSKADAMAYGNYIYTCQLELKNNLSNTQVTLDKKMLKNILDKLALTDHSYYQAFDDNEQQAINSLLKFNDSDTDIIGDIINGAGCRDEMLKVLSQYGYTHTIDNDSPELKTITHYVVYDLNAIKIMDKENIKTIQ